MRRALWGLGLSLAMSAASAQQVWRCEVDGKVNFSDKPCPQAGKPVAERSLRPNVVDAIKPELVDAAMGRGAASAPAAAPTPGNACPGDGELRGMETRAGSTTLGEPERQFLQDEVRRARQCRAGQGRYRDADWDISREAQAAQTQFSDRVRLAARERAESMHSAADPVEGDRIARRRLAEERAAQRQQRALQQGQNAASAPFR